MPTLIPATQRTMAVFEIFAREKRELSNSEMARLLEVADSSCLDLLHTLHTLGYLMRTPRTRRFYPTARLLEATRLIAQNDPLTTAAREAVEQLLDKTNESAFVGVLEAKTAKVAAAQSSRRPLRYTIEVGERAALHSTAMGKALLGILPPKELAARVQQLKLSALTSRTITDADTLIAHIEKCRKAGWYESLGEGGEDVSALAVSGWIGDQAVAISLAGPSGRIESNRDAYLQALRDVGATFLEQPRD